MATVEYKISVMAWSIYGPKLQKTTQLVQHSLQSQTAGGVVTAKRLHHVVGEEALHTVQHTCGAHVQLLDLLRWQQSGLAIRTVKKKEKVQQKVLLFILFD